MSKEGSLFNTSPKSQPSILINCLNVWTLAWRIDILARLWWIENLQDPTLFLRCPWLSSRKLMGRRCSRLPNCILLIWQAQRDRKWPMHQEIGWKKQEISTNLWPLWAWSSTPWPATRPKPTSPTEIQNWQLFWKIAWVATQKPSLWQQCQLQFFVSRRPSPPWILQIGLKWSKSKLW